MSTPDNRLVPFNRVPEIDMSHEISAAFEHMNDTLKNVGILMIGVQRVLEKREFEDDFNYEDISFDFREARTSHAKYANNSLSELYATYKNRDEQPFFDSIREVFEHPRESPFRVSERQKKDVILRLAHNRLDTLKKDRDDLLKLKSIESEKIENSYQEMVKISKTVQASIETIKDWGVPEIIDKKEKMLAFFEKKPAEIREIQKSRIYKHIDEEIEKIDTDILVTKINKSHADLPPASLYTAEKLSKLINSIIDLFDKIINVLNEIFTLQSNQPTQPHRPSL